MARRPANTRRHPTLHGAKIPAAFERRCIPPLSVRRGVFTGGLHGAPAAGPARSDRDGPG